MAAIASTESIPDAHCTLAGLVIDRCSRRADRIGRTIDPCRDTASRKARVKGETLSSVLWAIGRKYRVEREIL